MQSVSSFADLTLAFDFALVDDASGATERIEVSPSRFVLALPSALEGMERVVSPAEVEEVDLRGMAGRVRR